MEVESANPGPSTSLESSRLGLCEVCAYHNAKYTCPRCEVKTCSLNCNKIHKLEIECSGERDKTKFIPLNKFTNLDLSSDYRLLEEITRVVEVSKKGLNPLHKYPISKRHFKLKNEALKRKIDLKFLPNTFARHKNNKTRLNYQTKLINWHFDLVFINADLKFTETIPETTKLGSVLDKYLYKQENDEFIDKLQFYAATGINGIRVLLKAEQKKGKKFYELDVTDTVNECLQGKTIIEYPTIHIILKDHASCYDIIESDDEDDKQEMQNRIKTGKEVIDKIVKKSESDESLYNSLKNLLFASDYSDENDDDEGINDDNAMQ